MSTEYDTKLLIRAVLPQVWWGFEANQSLWKLTADSIVTLLSDPVHGPVAPYVFHSIAFGSEPIGDDVDGGPTQFTADLIAFKQRIEPFKIPVTISEDWDRPGIMSNQNWTGLGPVGMEIAPVIDHFQLCLTTTRIYFPLLPPSGRILRPIYPFYRSIYLENPS